MVYYFLETVESYYIFYFPVFAVVFSPDKFVFCIFLNTSLVWPLDLKSQLLSEDCFLRICLEVSALPAIGSLNGLIRAGTS